MTKIPGTCFTRCCNNPATRTGGFSLDYGPISLDFPLVVCDKCAKAIEDGSWSREIEWPDPILTNAALQGNLDMSKMRGHPRPY